MHFECEFKEHDATLGKNACISLLKAVYLSENVNEHFAVILVILTACVLAENKAFSAVASLRVRVRLTVIRRKSASWMTAGVFTDLSTHISDVYQES